MAVKRERRENQSRAVKSKRERVLLWRQVMQLDQNKGRAGEVSEDRADHETGDEGRTDETRIGQEMSVSAQGRHHAATSRITLRMCARV